MKNQEKRISSKTEREILARLQKRTKEYKEIKFFEFGKWSSVIARTAYFLGVNPMRVLLPAAVILAMIFALIFREKLVNLVSVFQKGF